MFLYDIYVKYIHGRFSYLLRNLRIMGNILVYNKMNKMNS